uniref:Uncharacterized protein n=1 Tax=Anguilla anguilla TaxID=7936 RepID=A0A0E9URU4_ANGAN
MSREMYYEPINNSGPYLPIQI